jgi:hypothetical protein
MALDFNASKWEIEDRANRMAEWKVTENRQYQF